MQYQTDIAIIGAGAAGIAAGIEAREAGARAIAFEKYSEPGGAAIISGGGCLIVGSPVQKARGIHDTPDLAFDDWINGEVHPSIRSGRVITSTTPFTISITGPKPSA